MMTSHTSPVDIEQAMPLAEMSVAQIAALPPAQLQEAHTNLLTLQSLVKGVLDRFHAALDQRYAEQAVAVRQVSGKDFGVCHLSDGPLRITVDVPKKVVDRISQEALRAAEVVRRLRASVRKEEPRRERCDVRPVLSAAASLIAAEARAAE